MGSRHRWARDGLGASVLARTEPCTSLLHPHLMPPAERSVTITSQQGELICITSSEMANLEPVDLIDLLTTEKAHLSVWYNVLLEYWRLGLLSKFEVLLRKTLAERCE